MKTLSIETPEIRPADIIAENIERLKQLFPEAWSEGKIDFEVLKQILGGVLDEREEKYGLNWLGKRRARQLALSPSTGTLRPCPEDSVDWDTTQNLMIEGDNLEVLKLFQTDSYTGKVKLIYIDPPYNTGNDYIYPDDFHDNIKNYLEISQQVENGRKISSNPETSGRFHTDWLNMIYPRLRLARNLLKRDGAIFVSCDEKEHPRLRSVLDEIFGQENFIADMVWAAGRKNDSHFISISHEYIVCYAYDAGFLTEQKIKWRQRKKGLEEIYTQYDRLKRRYGTDYTTMTSEMKKWYKELKDSHEAKAHDHFSHVDARGLYNPDNLSWPGGGGPKYEVLHPKTQKPVTVPSRGWLFTSDEMQRQMADDQIHFGEDETLVPCYKSYLKEHEYQAPYSVFYQDGRAATKRLRNLMNGDCFDFPKDELVLQEIISMMTSGEDIILDFFAGSGTTGHAVMAQNSVDGGDRRYILVQLPEPLDPDKKDQETAAAYCDRIGKPRNIAELTKERLRRAAIKIKGENPTFSSDLGFRVFKLDSSNIRIWSPNHNSLEQDLIDNVEHIEPGRNEQDILYELLLKLGLDLCVPIETQTIVGKTVHSIGAGTIFACLDKEIACETVESLALGIAAWHKELAPASESTVIFLDSAFKNDLAKANLTAILEQHGLEHIRSL